MPEEKMVRVIHGNEACVEGAVYAGCGFFAGYPITPASEVAEIMAQRLPENGGVFMQMEDELASINAVIGASWGGKKTMTATSGPGFSLKQEGIGYAVTTETPCVVLNVMRGGPSTGQPTLASQQDVYQAKYGSHGDYELIVLTPSSAQEAFDLTVRAFNLSEKYLVPVIILSDEIVGHTRERVVLSTSMPVENRRKPEPGQQYCPFRGELSNGGLPYRADFGEGHAILVDGQLHNEMGNRIGHLPDRSAALVDRLCRKITDNVDDIQDFEARWVEDADVVVFSYGSACRPGLRAVKMAREKGIKAGWIKLRTLFPFPEEYLRSIAGEKTFIVPELNMGKICKELEHSILRKVISMPKVGGELHLPREILQKIEEVVH